LDAALLHVADAIGWAVSKTDNVHMAYDVDAPE
jgi:hypothetical protein